MVGCLCFYIVLFCLVLLWLLLCVVPWSAVYIYQLYAPHVAHFVPKKTPILYRKTHHAIAKCCLLVFSVASTKQNRTTYHWHLVHTKKPPLAQLVSEKQRTRQGMHCKTRMCLLLDGSSTRSQGIVHHTAILQRHCLIVLSWAAGHTHREHHQLGRSKNTENWQRGLHDQAVASAKTSRIISR